MQSGASQNVGGSGVFNSNYWNGSGAYPVNGIKPVGGPDLRQPGQPESVLVDYGQHDISSTHFPAPPVRATSFRLPWQRNVDLTVTKDFRLPWEHHSLQFRADAFNVFNNVNFTGISLSISSPGTFGEFSTAQDARVLQLALRYSF